MDQIPLKISENRYIVYYDLTDPAVRAAVAKRYDFIVD
jgi:hypothetical protein